MKIYLLLSVFLILIPAHSMAADGRGPGIVERWTKDQASNRIPVGIRGGRRGTTGFVDVNEGKPEWLTLTTGEFDYLDVDSTAQSVVGLFARDYQNSRGPGEGAIIHDPFVVLVKPGFTQMIWLDLSYLAPEAHLPGQSIRVWELPQDISLIAVWGGERKRPGSIAVSLLILGPRGRGPVLSGIPLRVKNDIEYLTRLKLPTDALSTLLKDFAPNLGDPTVVVAKYLFENGWIDADANVPRMVLESANGSSILRTVVGGRDYSIEAEINFPVDRKEIFERTEAIRAVCFAELDQAVKALQRRMIPNSQIMPVNLKD